MVHASYLLVLPCDPAWLNRRDRDPITGNSACGCDVTPVRPSWTGEPMPYLAHAGAAVNACHNACICHLRDLGRNGPSLLLDNVVDQHPRSGQRATAHGSHQIGGRVDAFGIATKLLLRVCMHKCTTARPMATRILRRSTRILGWRT